MFLLPIEKLKNSDPRLIPEVAGYRSVAVS